MPGSLCNVHKGHTTMPRMWLCPPNPGSEQQIMASIAKPPLENIAWLCVMAACNILAPHRIPKNKCMSPRWPMNQRAMHHHDKLEDTWHAANIRWHTHSHVSRVRNLNEQALQCVCVVQVRRQLKLVKGVPDHRLEDSPLSQPGGPW